MRRHLTTIWLLVLSLIAPCLLTQAKGFRDNLKGLVYEVEDWSEPKDAIKKDDHGEGHWCLWTQEEDVWAKRSNGQSLKTPTVRKDRATPEEGAPVLHTKITGIPNGFYLVYMNNPNRLLALSQDGGKTWYPTTGMGEEFLGFHDIKDGTFEMWVDDRYANPTNIGCAYYDYIRFVPGEKPRMSDVTAFTRPDGSTQLTWMSSAPLPASVVRYRVKGGEWQSIKEERNNLRNHAVVLTDLEAGKDYEAQVEQQFNPKQTLKGNLLNFKAGETPKLAKTNHAIYELMVTEPTKSGRTDWHVHNGVPFKRGVLASAADVKLFTADEKAVKGFACEVMDRWDDGSVRWLTVDFPATTQALQTTEYKLICKPGIGRQEKRAGYPEGLLSSLYSVLTLQDGEVYTADFDNPEVIRAAGEAETALADFELAGDYVNSKGERLYRWRLRANGYGRSATMYFSVGNNNFKHVAVNVKSLSFGLLQDSWKGLTLADGTAVPAGSKIMQFTDSKATFTLGGKTFEREQFDGVLLENNGRDLVSLPNFRQTYPKGLEVNEKSLTWWLLPELPQQDYPPKGWNDLLEESRHWYWYKDGCYSFRQGVEVEHEFVLHCEPEGKKADPAWSHKPLFASCTPAYYCDSKVFGNLVPRSPEMFVEYEQALDQSFANQERSRHEILKEYGWMNYGDWFGERVYNWGNNEYDMGYMLAIQFARSGNLDWLWRGADMQKHYTTIDVNQFVPPKQFLKEFVYGHCVGHVGMFMDRSDERIKAVGRKYLGFLFQMHDAGHAHVPGMFYYASLLGDVRMRRVAERCAWNQAERYTPNFDFRIERAAGWPLINATYAYRFTNNPYYLNAGRIYFECIKSKQNPETGCFDLPQDLSECDCPDKAQHRGGKAFATGVLMHGLARLWEYTQDPDVKQCIVRCCDWLLDISWNEAKQGFRYKTGCPKFANNGWYATIVTEGIAYATELTGNPRYIKFLERTAGLPFSKGQGSGPSSGKNFAQFNRHIPHVLYYLHKNGITTLPIYSNPLSASTTVKLSPNGTGTLALSLNNRGKTPMACTLKLTASDGVTVEPAEISWETKPGNNPAPVITVKATKEYGDIRYELKYGKVTYQGYASVMRKQPLPKLGDGIGFIGAPEHFTLAALKKHGLQGEKIIDVNTQTLDGYKAVIIGGDAFSMGQNAPKPLTGLGVARLAAFAEAGGKVVCFQMNDTDWPGGWLGDTLLIEEPDSTVTDITDRNHWLMAGVENLRGMQCYDRVLSWSKAWRMLAKDSAGKPCIMSLTLGKGEIVVILPNVDRLYSEPAAMTVLVDNCVKIMENVVKECMK